MKSLFTKNFLMYAAVIVLSFTLLGTMFLYQVGRFSAEEQEKLASLEGGEGEEQ